MKQGYVKQDSRRHYVNRDTNVNRKFCAINVGLSRAKSVRVKNISLVEILSHRNASGSVEVAFFMMTKGME